ncbi:MAG: zinc metallopeptidase [Clostridia bacterium]|nr:zinc metallopeptidase [Clostridia bacterium]
MTYKEYFLFLGLILLCAIFSGWASRKVHTSFQAYANVQNRAKMTGYDTAVRLLRSEGITDISVNRVNGKLTDHYHPTKKAVNLSQSTYGDASVAAVAVAAHEIGHVVQKKKGYIPYNIRSVLVPIANVGSRLALPLVLVGILLDIFVAASQFADWGFYLAIAGVAAYGTATLFTLVTLPVELNASKRAKQMLLAEGILTEEELPGAEKVLSAAAMTYVAALLTSLVYFLRFAVWVLRLVGRNRD